MRKQRATVSKLRKVKKLLRETHEESGIMNGIRNILTGCVVREPLRWRRILFMLAVLFCSQMYLERLLITILWDISPKSVVKDPRSHTPTYTPTPMLNQALRLFHAPSFTHANTHAHTLTHIHTYLSTHLHIYPATYTHSRYTQRIRSSIRCRYLRRSDAPLSPEGTSQQTVKPTHVHAQL